MSRATAERLARRGVARVFQTPRLLGASSLRDNVLLGAYARERAGGPATVLRLPRARRERAELVAEADRLLVATAWPGGRTRRPPRCRTASSGCWRWPGR
ncbi:hypothetical protein ACFQY7_06365 [Actinomadura luteofluorescens]|uniref:hypothetical protein n=1 Tax=Actinomadura luteofluorescens TaxID=46163 RepID=UPI0036449035